MKGKEVILTSILFGAVTGYIIGKSIGFREASKSALNLEETEYVSESFENELTFLMPCYNEEETIGNCVDEAKKFLEDFKVNGEVLVVDNNSTDNSAKIALEHGARVITETEQGYGSALRAGINAAKGKYIIMGDCDMSYDFYHVDRILARLREGYELVMGNRIPEKGATPWTHQYIGVPVLSMLARIRFNCYITDYHCGIRGMNTTMFQLLDLNCTGMEFATEMIAKAKKAGYSITQVDVPLRKDGRSVPPKLNPIRDGIRHLKFIFGGKI